MMIFRTQLLNTQGRLPQPPLATPPKLHNQRIHIFLNLVLYRHLRLRSKRDTTILQTGNPARAQPSPRARACENRSYRLLRDVADKRDGRLSTLGSGGVRRGQSWSRRRGSRRACVGAGAKASVAVADPPRQGYRLPTLGSKAP
eukprot:1274871-Amorphochlora_amoeboformis.AAC.2